MISVQKGHGYRFVVRVLLPQWSVANNDRGERWLRSVFADGGFADVAASTSPPAGWPPKPGYTPTFPEWFAWVAGTWAKDDAQIVETWGNDLVIESTHDAGASAAVVPPSPGTSPARSTPWLWISGACAGLLAVWLVRR